MAYEDDFRYDSDYDPYGYGRGRYFRGRGPGYPGEFWPRYRQPGEPGWQGRAGWDEVLPGRRGGPGRRAGSYGYGGQYSAGSRWRGRSGRDRWGNFPPDYRRYLSEDEYGLPGWESARGREHDRDTGERVGGRRRDRFDRGALGPRNALFGREGFARYGQDYEQWW